MIHTNAIAYGFLANAFLGMLEWVVPRLTLKPVFDRRLSYAIFFAWQGVVIATAIGILFGEAQGLEWGETPVWIDPIALAGLLLVAINFVAPIANTRGPMYVTLWYFLAAFVWTFLTYAMGNFIPQYFVSGTSCRSSRRTFHPRPGRAVRHSPGLGNDVLLRADHAQEADLEPWTVAGRLLGAGIFLSVDGHPPLSVHADSDVPPVRRGDLDDRRGDGCTDGDHQLSRDHRGSTRALVTNMPIRWLYTGIMFYFLTCLQCAFQTTLTFQALIHFTDWVVGHAHMVMFGVFSMWLLGVMTYLDSAASQDPVVQPAASRMALLAFRDRNLR